MGMSVGLGISIHPGEGASQKKWVCQRVLTPSSVVGMSRGWVLTPTIYGTWDTTRYILLECFLVTFLNEVAKVMFLHVSVCPQGGGAWACTPSVTRYPLRDQVHPLGTRYTLWDQVHPPMTRNTPWDQVHLPTRYTPRDQVHPWDQLHPPGPGTPPRRRLLLRTVRILLECILVYFCFLSR